MTFLHIVDNPGGTPVNKKMTIGQLFENIPTHLAVDDITTLTATASNLASSFATAIDLSGASADVAFHIRQRNRRWSVKSNLCFN